MINYNNYTIKAINNNLIELTNNTTGTTKQVKIKYDYEFILKVQKTQLKSRYNAFELLEEFNGYIKENFMTSYINMVCREYVG